MSNIELSIVMPCLNEELTLGNCIDKSKSFLKTAGIIGEVVVADNGSADRSVEIALKHGAHVVYAEQKGYGSALRAGFSAAKGKYVIMGDADESYDFLALMPFVEKLREGYDLVMGNRFAGGIAPGAMPWHHKYIGNPVLSFIGRLFFKIPIRDFHCGLRGLRKEAIEKMELHTTGMEFASEIVVKAALLKMKVCEVPTTLSPDGRDRPPHLRSFRDGWRHLRFLLIYSPRWLFLYPGLFFLIIGGIFSLSLFFGPVNIGWRQIDFHSFIYAGAISLIGLNMLTFAVIIRIYAQQQRLLPQHQDFQTLLKFINLENGLLLGTVILLAGLVLGIWAVIISRDAGFSMIGFSQSIRLVYASSLALVFGMQVITASFVLSILGLKTK